MPNQLSAAELILGTGVVTTTGNNLYVNGLLVGSGTFSTLAALSETGVALMARDIAISGALQTLINDASSDVNSINGQSGTLVITGAGNVSVTSGGANLIIVSGIEINVANFGFVSNVPTGVDSFFVPYPIGLTGVPVLGVTMETYGSVDVPSMAISGRTSAGFSTLLSDSALLTGLSLNILVQGVADVSSIAYVSGVPTGVISHFFHFPNYTFVNPPKVNVTWETELFNVMYGAVISGRATSGFNAIFTDTVLETGLYLNIIARA